MVSVRDIEKALMPKKRIDPATVVPPEYHDLLDIFLRQAAD